MSRSRALRPLILAVVCTVLLGGAAAPGAEVSRTFRFDRDELLVRNLIGRVDITRAAGDEFVVTVNIRGKDAAEDVLELLSNDGGEEFVVRFPVDEHDDYVYPPLGRGNRSTFTQRGQRSHGGSWLREIFSGLSEDRVTVRGSGRGLEIWADLEIAVPVGATLDLRHGLGAIAAEGVEGDLSLDGNAGPVTVSDVAGDVVVDTGSGQVALEQVRGRIVADTGSGQVRLTDCEGSEILVDTGSGATSVRNVRCRRLVVDTGSGGVEAEKLDADEVLVDTGSGHVTLDLDRLGDGRCVVDTGSGGVELILPDGASARIAAETGGGRISCDLEGAEILRKERDEMVLEVGGGAAEVRLDTGSGHIRIRGRRS